MTNSKPIAVDRHDFHVLLDLIGGYGVVVGIIATLSVCAAFFIYRSVRGQRGKGRVNNGNDTNAATEDGTSARIRRERGDQPTETESTGEDQEAKQKTCCVESESRDDVDLATNNILLSTEVSKKDLNESTLKDLEVIMEPESEDKADSEDQEAKQKTCCVESESMDDIDLATNNILLSTEVSEKDLNESTLKDLEVITDELLTEMEPESEEKADSEDQEAKQKTCCVESESMDDIDLATNNILLSTEVSEKDLNESTLKDLEVITDELLTEMEPESEDKADSEDQEAKQKTCCVESESMDDIDLATNNILLSTEVSEKDLNESTLKDLEEITDEQLSEMEPDLEEKADSEDQEAKQKTCCVESESMDDIDLATNSILLSTEVSEKDLNESTLKDLEEITDEHLSEMEPESEDKADSDLDQCMEMDPDKPDDNMEFQVGIQHEDAGRECVEEICDDVNVQFTRLEGQHETDEMVKQETEEHLRDHDKSETELSVDTDEPSETESAREIIYEKHQDVVTCKPHDDLHGHVFTSQSTYFSDQAADPSNRSKIGSADDHKTSTVEEVDNTSLRSKFEDHHDWRFPRTKDFDCNCYDKKTDPVGNRKCQPWFHCGSPNVETVIKHQHHSNKFDYPTEPPQNYLGFQPDNSFISGASTRESVEKKADEEGASMEKKHDKNEISIMDAIMDNNEWLNVGGPEFRDLPWLSQTATSASSIDEKRANREKEEMIVTQKDSLAKDDEELANKRVATVQPLPQQVHITFRVHYITYSSSQLLAVTGSLQELGAWESFVPLHRAKDGFWANTITLPVDSQVEWKFVVVDDGKISRWEECCNRYLVLSSHDDDLHLNKSWGYI